LELRCDEKVFRGVELGCDEDEDDLLPPLELLPPE
jgi:hypothetical protein